MPLIPIFQKIPFQGSRGAGPSNLQGQAVTMTDPDTGLLVVRNYSLMTFASGGNNKLLGARPDDTGQQPACCTWAVFRCTDNSATGGYIGVGPSTINPFYFVDNSDNNCYYATPPAFDCTVHKATVTDSSPTDSCATCDNQFTCNCPPSANDRQCAHVSLSSTYTVQNAASFICDSGCGVLPDECSGTWDGTLVRGTVGAPNPSGGCSWTDTSTAAANDNTYGCGNGGTLCNSAGTVRVTACLSGLPYYPPEGDGQCGTCFNCAWCTDCNGNLTAFANFGTTWVFQIYWQPCGQQATWIKPFGCTPAGTYTYCPGPGECFTCNSGNLVIA